MAVGSLVWEKKRSICFPSPCVIVLCIFCSTGLGSNSLTPFHSSGNLACVPFWAHNHAFVHSSAYIAQWRNSGTPRGRWRWVELLKSLWLLCNDDFSLLIFFRDTDSRVEWSLNLVCGRWNLLSTPLPLSLHSFSDGDAVTRNPGLKTFGLTHETS